MNFGALGALAPRDAVSDLPHAQSTLIEALAWEKGLPAPRWYHRNDLRIANALFGKRVMGEEK